MSDYDYVGDFKDGLNQRIADVVRAWKTVLKGFKGGRSQLRVTDNEEKYLKVKTSNTRHWVIIILALVKLGILYFVHKMAFGIVGSVELILAYRFVPYVLGSTFSLIVWWGVRTEVPEAANSAVEPGNDQGKDPLMDSASA